MKSPFYLIALALILGLSNSASAGPYDHIKSQAACEQAGAVWDREADRCVPKNSKKACAQRGGIWDEGSSTCSVPK